TYRLDSGAPVREEEVEIEAGGRPAAALLFHPGGRRPVPGWAVLHGITVPGMRHPALLRFARAIAGSGAAVLVPEIESWKRLRVDPGAADAAVAGAARYLGARPEVREGGVGVVGFSFGATQALVTAASPEIRPLVR